MLTTFDYLVIESFDWYGSLTAPNMSATATTVAAAGTCAAAVFAARSAKMAEQAGQRSFRSELRSEAAQLRSQIDHERAKMVQKAQRASKSHEHLRRLHSQDRTLSSTRFEHMKALDGLAGNARAYNGLSARYGNLRERKFEAQDGTSFAKLQDDLLGLNLKTKDIDVRHYRHCVEMSRIAQFSGYEIPFEMDALKVL